MLQSEQLIASLYEVDYGEASLAYIVLHLKFAELDEFCIEKGLLLLIRITVFSSGNYSYIVFRF